MTRILLLALLAVTLVACSEATEPDESDLTLTQSNLSLDWGIERGSELNCGGREVAGGQSSGTGVFSRIGLAQMMISAAWDIGAVDPDPTNATFTPSSPAAAGPFAPVLGPEDYPYDFKFNPITRECGQAVAATGEMIVTAENGDEVHGLVTGGETHRLDFSAPGAGDGIETFATIVISGGTGRFANASGDFVVHTITRFDFTRMEFVIDLAEMLSGGTISY